jgi:hypothetical protein
MIELLIAVSSCFVCSEQKEPKGHIAFAIEKSAAGEVGDSLFLTYSPTGTLRDRLSRVVTEQDIAKSLKKKSGKRRDIRVLFLAPSKTSLEDLGKLMDLFCRNNTSSVPVLVTFVVKSD